MIKQRERHVEQPVSNTFSFNTANTLKGILDRISINPSSTSTTYDIQITDSDNTVIYEKKGRQGHWVDDSNISVWGIHTVTVSNTSVSNVSFITTLLWSEQF